MSVFRRPGSPYYYAEFQFGGARICRSTRKRTEREARTVERDFKAEVRKKAAEGRKSATLTIDQGFGKYWTEHALKKLSPRWQVEVERYIAGILALIEKDMLIEDVTDAEVNDYVQAYLDKGGGNYALNRSLAVWRAMHKKAAKKWKQRTQEIDWADFLEDEAKRVRHISIDEARGLIDVMAPRTALAVEWSLYTATRKFETFGLVWEDVHLDAGNAIVTAKGGRRHTVWLSEQAMNVLARCERRGRYVFDGRNARKNFEAAVKKSGLLDFRWHDLRHTAATWARQAGTPVEVVQRILGHADIETTMRYAHVVDSEVQEAMRNLPTISTNTQKIVRFTALKNKANKS
jgi:integrase